MAASEAVALLDALRAQAAEVAAHGREMLRRVRGGQLDTKEGVSLLQVRCHALLSYLQDLALLAGAKCRGAALRRAGGARERLLETRVVLEKLRPLEQRLRHHLEKLLRAAAAGGRGAEDPLSFRPAPSNMAAQDEEDGEEEGDEGQRGGAKATGRGGGRGRYVPPRLVPVTAPPSPDSRSRLRARRRALGSALIRELREELGEGPLELGEGLLRPSRQELHRQRYEESMLQRLSAPRRPRGAGPELDDVTKFGAFPALLGEAANQESSEPAKKKRKKQKPGKRSGKRGFRRRRR